VIAAAETGIAAACGTVLGWLGYLVGRGVVADTITFSGARFMPADVAAPTSQLAAVLVGVPLLVMATTLATLIRVPVTHSASANRPAGHHPARPAPYH
jgi:hypothetical protein